MTVMAVYHIKGGVGKTSTAVNLAYLAAQSGKRVLLWDLDPQAAASFYFRVKPKVKGGSKKLLNKEDAVFDAIKASDFPNLDILPADFSYRKLDRQLPSKQSLRDVVSPLREVYDLIVLDCPPNITHVSENIFRACDALLVPLIPTTLSLRTLEQLIQFFMTKKMSTLKMMPFFSMADKRRKMHKDIMDSLPGRLPGLLKTSIPNASDVERMGLKRAPVPVFAANSEAAKAYMALLAEVEGKL